MSADIFCMLHRNRGSSYVKKIKHLVLGQSLRSDALDHEKFSVIWGLPVLSSDAISSVSYACEEILMVLIPVLGMASYGLLMKVGFAIVFLLFILVFSYRLDHQLLSAGRGSYIVASDKSGKGIRIDCGRFSGN